MEENPKDKARLWSLLTFIWLNPLINLGNQRPLELHDLPSLSEEDRSETLTTQLECNWSREQERAKIHLTTPSLWRAIFGIISVGDILYLTFLTLTYILAVTVAPLFLYGLIITLSERDTTSALLYAIGIIVSTFLCGFTQCHSRYRSSILGMRVRTAITGIIYKKVLLFTQEHLTRITSGHVINLLSNDLERFQLTVMYLPSILFSPLQILIFAVIVYWIAGWPSLVGLAVIAVLVMYQAYGTTQCANIYRRAARITDRRITLLKEIIMGIRTVKMHSWEEPYNDVIIQTRKMEVKKLRKRWSIVALLAAFHTSTLAMFGVVLCLVFTGRQASVTVIFPVMLAFSTLKNAAHFSLGYGLERLQNCRISEKRIGKFLRDSELVFSKPECRRHSTYPNMMGDTDRKHVNTFLDVEELTINFGIGEEWNVLHNVSLRAWKNDLITVIGAVGSGKSTLLSAILGEVSSTRGKINLRGTIAHVPQVPWIFLGTVRENITFYLPFDHLKYEKVIEACDLSSDFELFPNGDMSVIGERGIALSGGQRARVSLARAVYADADIYLLDDPLSAVDLKVGKHIFKESICGLLGGRLRILVTHQHQYLEHSDRVIVMEKGKIVNQTYYQDFIRDKANSKISLPRDAVIEDETSSVPTDDEMHENHGKGLSVVEEDRDTGNISWKTYWIYLRAGLATPLIVGLLFVVISTPVVDSLPGVVMSNWTDVSWEHPGDRGSIINYICLRLLGTIFMFLRPFLIYQTVLTCTTALHNKMTRAVVRSPVLFFDTNPVGRILNRFSADVGQLDDVFPFAVGMSALIADVTVMLALPALANYWLALCSIPPILAYIWYGRRFLRVSREVTRLQSLARTPVQSHFANTLEGLTTIKGHQAQDSFTRNMFRKQDHLCQAWFSYLSITMWLTLRCYVISSLFLAVLSICSVLLATSPGITAFVIIYAYKLIGSTNYMICNISEAENLMTSVQRMITYTTLDHEPAYDIKEHPPRNWPQYGLLQFDSVSLKYHDGGPQVLKNITFRVNSQEKVGIAGRTGAGKSSLITALMRMPQGTNHIILDGIDIHGLNLQSSRRAISVIQQNPILFCRSIRDNLDPFGTFTDDEIWCALQSSQLGSLVAKLRGGLEYEVKEGGSNFSVGERQLFCLARALLHRNKVIVMDEATANVDPQTDQMIQTTIREKFKDCTVLIIAHRLSTIMDCDRIMVLNNGELVEFDKPHALMNNSKGWFAQLWQHSQKFNGQ